MFVIEDTTEQPAAETETTPVTEATNDNTASNTPNSESPAAAADAESTQDTDANPEDSPDKQQSRDDILKTLNEWGVDEQALSTFKKLTNNLDFPQFIDKAIGLFPDVKDLFEQFDEIDKKELSKEDVKTEKGAASSKKIDALLKKFDLTDDEEKVAELALKIVAFGAHNFADWFGDNWKDSDLRRLIDAVVQGADYNSAGAMSNKYKEAGKENQISVADFFDKFKNSAKDSKLKIEEAHKKIKGEINWSGGDKILLNEEGKDDNEVLRDYFIALTKHIHNSTAENLLWKSASDLIVKEVFGEKKVLDPNIYKELVEMSKDGNSDKANGLFILK